MTPRTLQALAHLVVLSLTFASTAGAQQYTARHNGDVVELHDAKHQTTVSLIPSIGNVTSGMKVKEHDVLRWPPVTLEEFKARPQFSGNPFLAPWANRLDEQAFYANGRRYAFDMTLGNVRGNIPIHGMLAWTNEWELIDVSADATSARTTSRLEFFRNPMWMKQFPFAHTIDITHTLQDGVLQVTTRIHNLSNEPMPVSIGFHPYFQLTDSSRDEWTISVGAKTHWRLAQNKVPTGETEPIEALFPDPKAISLKDYDLDHVFGDLVRDDSGRAVMSMKGKSQQLDVVLGPNYRAMVIYAPKPAVGVTGQTPNSAAQDRNYICFEPMVGITNAMNLAHKGLYKELQSVAPGATWEESFWVRVRGF
jgi:aldose 1-epimerase